MKEPLGPTPMPKDATVTTEPVPYTRPPTLFHRVPDPLGIYERRNRVIYELGNGQQFVAAFDMVEKYGIEELLKRCGLYDRLASHMRRLPLIYHGRQHGTMAATFDNHPAFIKSKSYFYQPREGDFTLVGYEWHAANNLGVGDIEAVEGWQP